MKTLTSPREHYTRVLKKIKQKKTKKKKRSKGRFEASLRVLIRFLLVFHRFCLCVFVLSHNSMPKPREAIPRPFMKFYILSTNFQFFVNSEKINAYQVSHPLADLQAESEKLWSSKNVLKTRKNKIRQAHFNPHFNLLHSIQNVIKR